MAVAIHTMSSAVISVRAVPAMLSSALSDFLLPPSDVACAGGGGTTNRTETEWTNGGAACLQAGTAGLDVTGASDPCSQETTKSLVADKASASHRCALISCSPKNASSGCETLGERQGYLAGSRYCSNAPFLPQSRNHQAS